MSGAAAILIEHRRRWRAAFIATMKAYVRLEKMMALRSSLPKATGPTLTFRRSQPFKIEHDRPA